RLAFALASTTPAAAERAVDLLAGLNRPQRAAVTADDGPLLIFAVACSGRTRVLTHRIAWLIQQGRADPGEILAVTFTNKAARAPRTRSSPPRIRSARPARTPRSWRPGSDCAMTRSSNRTTRSTSMTS